MVTKVMILISACFIYCLHLKMFLKAISTVSKTTISQITSSILCIACSGSITIKKTDSNYENLYSNKYKCKNNFVENTTVNYTKKLLELTNRAFEIKNGKYQLDSTKEQNIDIAIKYIKNGANVNVMDIFEQKRISEYWINFESVFKIMLEHGLDLSLSNSLGYSMLHLIALENKVNLIKMCIDMGKNYHLDIVDSNSKTPLFYACRKSNIEIIDLIYNDKTAQFSYLTPDLDISSRTVLHDAIEFRRKEVLRILLHKDLGLLKIPISIMKAPSIVPHSVLSNLCLACHFNSAYAVSTIIEKTDLPIWSTEECNYGNNCLPLKKALCTAKKTKKDDALIALVKYIVECKPGIITNDIVNRYCCSCEGKLRIQIPKDLKGYISKFVVDDEILSNTNRHKELLIRTECYLAGIKKYNELSKCLYDIIDMLYTVYR